MKQWHIIRERSLYIAFLIEEKNNNNQEPVKPYYSCEK
jgi:hypothetical protein